MSFGRALPVGVGSRAEWINVFFRELVAPDAVANALEAQLPSGMRLLRVELLDVKKHQPQALAEDYTLTVFSGSLKRGIHEVWTAFDSSKSWVVPMAGKKGVLREKDIRPYVLESSFPGPGIVSMLLDWRENYVSPLRLVLAACPGLELGDFNLVKEQQWMESNLHWRLSAMCSIDRCE
jgi:radical SAM-linked protein